MNNAAWPLRGPRIAGQAASLAVRTVDIVMFAVIARSASDLPNTVQITVLPRSDGDTSPIHGAVPRFADDGGDALLVDVMPANLADPANGYTVVSAAQAQALANEGELGIIAGPGHVAMVRSDIDPGKKYPSGEKRCPRNNARASASCVRSGVVSALCPTS